MIRRGMTLLELLCASTLATLLMVAVLGVVGSLARAEKTLNRHDPQGEWRRRLVAQIAGDLRAARSAEPLPTGIRLKGQLGQNAANGTAEWIDAVIEYRVEPTPLGSALVRLSMADDGCRLIEPLVFSVGCFMATGTGSAVTIPAAKQTFINEVFDGRSVPGALRVTLYDQSGDLLFDEEIVAR